MTHTYTQGGDENGLDRAYHEQRKSGLQRCSQSRPKSLDVLQVFVAGFLRVSKATASKFQLAFLEFVPQTARASKRPTTQS
jgi:hypothetical protein